MLVKQRGKKLPAVHRAMPIARMKRWDVHNHYIVGRPACRFAFQFLFQPNCLSLPECVKIYQSRILHRIVGLILATVEYNEIDRSTLDRKSTRLNSSHVKISYAVFCLKKKIFVSDL